MWCAGCSAVRSPVCPPEALECTRPLMNMNEACGLIVKPRHVPSQCLRPLAHQSALSHSVTHDNQERDYGDQINYGLIQNTTALTTVNPGPPWHRPRLITLISLEHRLSIEDLTCPSLVYWYCLSFTMTATIFLRKCHWAGLFSISFFLKTLLMSPFPLRDFMYETRVIRLHVLCPAQALLLLSRIHLYKLRGPSPSDKEIYLCILYTRRADRATL